MAQVSDMQRAWDDPDYRAKVREALNVIEMQPGTEFAIEARASLPMIYDPIQVNSGPAPFPPASPPSLFRRKRLS